MLLLDVAPELNEEWGNIIYRELELTVSSLDPDLAIRVSFERMSQGAPSQRRYVCVVEIRDEDVSLARARAEHTSGRFAVRYALTRARRSIRRFNSGARVTQRARA